MSVLSITEIGAELTKEQQEEQLNIYEKLSEQFSLLPIRTGFRYPKEKGWGKYCVEKRPFRREDFIETLPNGKITVLNAGVATGPASGVIVLDIDDQEAFEKYCEDNCIELHLPDTFTVFSGGKSVHYYYAYPQDGREYGRKSFGGFDIFGTGGQIFAPGSIHHRTSLPYTILRDIEIAEAPGSLLDLARITGGNKRASQTVKPLELTPEQVEFDSILNDEGPVSFTEIAGKMLVMGFSFSAVVAVLEAGFLNRSQRRLDGKA
jgi:hypothetical protein